MHTFPLAFSKVRKECLRNILRDEGARSNKMVLASKNFKSFTEIRLSALG